MPIYSYPFYINVIVVGITKARQSFTHMVNVTNTEIRQILYDVCRMVSLPMTMVLVNEEERKTQKGWGGLN
jgi:hypothetical protein